MRNPTGGRLRRGGTAALVCVALLLSCSASDDSPGADTTQDGAAGPPPPASDLPEPDTEPAPEPDPDEAPPAPDSGNPEPGADVPEVPLVDRTELVARVETLIAQTLGELGDAELGVLIVDPEGRSVGAHQAEQPMLPASTMKLVTAAAILRTLGPEARLTTTVETTAAIDGDGVLRGDLHLSGTGDPLLATPEYGRWIYPARPRTPMEVLADDLVDAGLTRLRGDVLGYADRYVGPTTAEGWIETYFNDFDARYVGGLTADAGIESRISWSGERPDPDDAGTRPSRVILELADDPARNAALLLIRMLEHRGVRVDGTARAEVPDQPAVGRLTQVESPPMADQLRFMVQRSDNHLADTLLHLAGRVRTGEGSWERGERAALQVLDLLEVDRSGVRLADGSGLSRDDRLTARSLVELDRAMTAGRHGETWQSLMAVAGESGTLSTRLRGTPAQGRLLAKTGSLRDVSSLSGFVHDDAGKRHHFAIIANRARGTDRAVIRAFADELSLLLTADLLDCAVRSDSSESDGPLGRAPIAIAC